MKKFTANLPLKDPKKFHNKVRENLRENHYKSWLGLLPLPLIRFWAGDKFVIKRDKMDVIKKKDNPIQKKTFGRKTSQNFVRRIQENNLENNKNTTFLSKLLDKDTNRNNINSNKNSIKSDLFKIKQKNSSSNFNFANSIKNNLPNNYFSSKFQNSDTNLNNSNNNLFIVFLLGFGKSIFSFLLVILILIFRILENSFGFFDQTFGKFFDRGRIAWLSFLLCFAIITLHIANLQVASQEIFTNLETPKNIIISSRRGQIFIQNIGLKKTIPLTNTQISGNLFIDPMSLKKISGKIPLNEIVNLISGSLNLSYNEIESKLGQAINSSDNSNYQIIHKSLDKNQTESVNSLIQNTGLKSSQNYLFSVSSWLGVEELPQRSYPQNQTLASTVGYVSRQPIAKSEIINGGGSCAKTAIENELRKTESKNPVYTVGYYGLEQKYCYLLGGLNGRNIIGGNKNNPENQDLPVQNGKDIYLTIDLGLQQKAEEILAKTIKTNTNPDGRGPRNGSIIVMNPQTGKILAMANYPSFDPNKYWESDSEKWRNIATSEDYEVGSSMKPLTVAAALNEYQTGNLSSKGERLGISPTWAKADRGLEGKIYQEMNGKGEMVDSDSVIRNSQKRSYKEFGNLPLKIVIRDSINTLISDITDSMGNVKLREYFEEKFLFDKPTSVAFAGGGSGETINSSLKANIQCQFCYAQHGFGQGFKIAPIQLMRAFTAIANEGKLVEPYLIDKIVDENGKIDDGSEPNSPINRPKPYPILSAQSTRLVTKYMEAVIDEGYLGQTPRSVPGYGIAAKTGTAQIITTIKTRDKSGKEITVPCNYQCSTERGLFDHSLIGFGPTSNPQVMVMVKLSEPRPGIETNFADSTSMPAFLEMTKFALEYLGVPKDR